MGVLDTVLRYKEQKDAQRNADINAIPQAMMQFQAGRQQATDNLLKTLTLQATLAKSGLAIGQNNQLIKDDSLIGNDLMLKQQMNQQKLNTMKSKENLYNKMIEAENSGDSDPEAILKKASENTGFGTEDFNVEPLTRMVAGVPHTAYVPKLKNQLPAGLEKEYRGFAKVGMGLSQNLKMLADNPEFEKEMSPTNIKAMRPGTFLGNIGNFIMKADPKSKNFATFKAETDKVFQAFRKETTGAQAALAELGWLAPDYPETTDNPELYKEKANVALQRIAEGEQLLLNNWNAQGYRTSKLKELGSPASKNGTVEVGTVKPIKGGGSAKWDGKGWVKQ